MPLTRFETYLVDKAHIPEKAGALLSPPLYDFHHCCKQGYRFWAYFQQKDGECTTFVQFGDNEVFASSRNLLIPCSA